MENHTFDADPIQLTVKNFGLASTESPTLSLDEFFRFDPELKVKRTPSKAWTSDSIPIKEACRSLRLRHKETSNCYTLCLSADDEINAIIDIPEQVQSRSMFHLSWPIETRSIFFKNRNKLFHTFQDRYKSRPYMTYAGLTEWVLILSGSLTITLIKPTPLNLLRYSACRESEDEFVPEQDTSKEIKLKPGFLFMIPTDWISLRRATKFTTALGGEILDCLHLKKQLESLERDTVQTSGRYGQERDSEIRHLYWFYTLHILVGGRASKIPSSDLESLRGHLSNWRTKYKKADKEGDPYVLPTLFAPQGIQIDRIMKDLGGYIRRRSFKGTKDSVDI